MCGINQILQITLIKLISDNHSKAKGYSTRSTALSHFSWGAENPELPNLLRDTTFGPRMPAGTHCNKPCLELICSG